MNNDIEKNDEILKYAQERFHYALIAVLKAYEQLNSKIDLQNITTASITFETRLSLASGIHTPNRSKGLGSFLKNTEKEFKSALDTLPNNPSKQDIDNSVLSAINRIIKDLYGATLILHTSNDLDSYCNKSSNPQILIYQQLSKGIENYLLQSELINKQPSSKKSPKKIDISATFIDGEKNPNESKFAVPVNSENLNNLEDYYNQLISLLTLLTNASIYEIVDPYTGKNGTDRISSELDMPIYEFIHLIQLSDEIPQSNYDYIKKLNSIAKIYYHTYGKKETEETEQTKIKNSHPELAFFAEHLDYAHKPFDVQLENAISEKQKYTKEELSVPFTKNQKEYYKIKIDHLKRNLELIKNDRLQNYILNYDITKGNGEISKNIKRLCNLPNFDVDIVSKKIVAKMNGFVSAYYILRINDLSTFELQVRDEFRNILAQEGNSAHNSLPGKSFDIMQFFELANPTHNEETNAERLSTFCEFLNWVPYNSVKFKLDSSTSENKLFELVDFVKSRIKIKDSFNYEYYFSSNEIPYTYQSNEKLSYSLTSQREEFKRRIKSYPDFSFYDYIQNIINYYCAKFGDIQANHSDGDHNTVQIKNKTDKDTLLSFFRNRIGLSVLAYMIIHKYTKQFPETLRSDYSTISSLEEADEAIRRATEKALAKFQSDSSEKNKVQFNSNFYPQGSYPPPNPPPDQQTK